MRTLTQKLSGDTAIDPISVWERMSIDEYAEFEMVMGAKLQKKGGVWWHQIRPYFYRPLFPFVELSPNQTKGLFGKFAAFQHPELMLHTIRISAGKRSDIRRIYTGMLSSTQSVNNFKIERGASVLALPAYLHLHPVFFTLISIVRKNLFKRLKGMDQRQIQSLIKRTRPANK